MLHPTVTGVFAEGRRRRLQDAAESHALRQRSEHPRPARVAAPAPAPVDIERVVVRPMRHADLVVVRAMLAAHGHRPDMHKLAPALGVVALADDVIVGVAVSYFFYYREGGSEVAVAPKWQGAGVGRFLAQALGRELAAAQPAAGAA